MHCTIIMEVDCNMLEIGEVKIENERECITDNPAPRISFSLYSDEKDVYLEEAQVRVNGWVCKAKEQLDIAYAGEKLEPFTRYKVEIEATDNKGCLASGTSYFQTGRMGTAWHGKWISDSSCMFEDTISPPPFTFRKRIHCGKAVKKAYLTATAMGIYELSVNGEKIGNEYFAPGFTSYANTLQYNFYDCPSLLQGENEIIAVVGGGWAVGRSTYIDDTNKSLSKISADSPAFLMDLYVEYADGSMECFGTDESWEVTQNGNYKFGDFYDGEIYDAGVDLDRADWKPAAGYEMRIQPMILARYGNMVTAHERFVPKLCSRSEDGELIYDFGQNFAGVISIKLVGRQGQKIVIRHAEALDHGKLYTDSLRTAKASFTYICRSGKQEYSPRLTYMGFRYISITGIEPENMEEISARALYSDFEEVGEFMCSNEDLNRLQSNIVWSGKSNFVDIPTDCPQRDERQGWTGDIALFGSTACFNFDLSRFLDKWLLDMKNEQGEQGSIPFVIPKRGSKTPSITTSCWGDSCILVPWAEYLSNGSISLLKRQYPTMRKYMDDVKRWAEKMSGGKTKRRIWELPFHFGDWCAPYGNIKDWLGRGKWVGTAYWAYSCELMSRIAGILEKPADQKMFKELREEICLAYEKEFTDGCGRLKDEFQTGYILPLYFKMTDSQKRAVMAQHLWDLIEENGVHLDTGFTATPFILFALADNGKLAEAYKLLLQDTCPSWLYQIRKGATTFWEQWDTIRPDGGLKEASMNHYAYGAVGDFLYRRVCGLEPRTGGYRTFVIRPRVGGGLTWAQCSHKTRYGLISLKWELADGRFRIRFTVPVSTECELILPSGKSERYGSGSYQVQEDYVNEGH